MMPICCIPISLITEVGVIGGFSKPPSYVTTTLQHGVEQGWADPSRNASEATSQPQHKLE